MRLARLMSRDGLDNTTEDRQKSTDPSTTLCNATGGDVIEATLIKKIDECIYLLVKDAKAKVKDRTRIERVTYRTAAGCSTSELPVLLVVRRVNYTGS